MCVARIAFPVLRPRAPRLWTNPTSVLVGSDRASKRVSKEVGHLRSVCLVLVNRGEQLIASLLAVAGAVHATTGVPSAMNEVVTLTLACPSLDQLEEMVDEAVDVLQELPVLPFAAALHVQATQCRDALRASRRHAFGPFVQRALSTKVLRLKIDALSYRESSVVREHISSGTMKAAPRGWADDEEDEVCVHDGAGLVGALPGDRL